MQTPRGKIISLNYHEVTQDARVMKQARSLIMAGYEVQVLCNQPKGFAQFDTIEKINVTRFDWQSIHNVGPSIFEKLPFLNRSRAELERRFMPFAAACAYLNQIAHVIESRLGPDAFSRADSKNIEQKTGLAKFRGLIDYFYVNIALNIMKTPVNGKNSAGRAMRRLKYHQFFKKPRRALQQARALLYAANLPDLDNVDAICAIHAHDIYCLPAGVMLAQKYQVPLIYDAHEYEPARGAVLDAHGRNLSEMIEDDCFPHVARIITVSDGIGALYAARFDGPMPTIVMNAPEIDLEKVQNGPSLAQKGQSLRTQIGLSDDVPLIAFTGLAQRAGRGLDKVLAALTLLPKAHLAIMGPREIGSDRWLQRQARKQKISRRIHLLAPVAAHDVPAVIMDATVAIVPIQDVSLSYRFCMPNKLFEAAFANVPLCVSDLPELRRFVETIGNGRVMDQTDPHAIANALQEVITNRDAYLLNAEGRKKLTETYSWQKQSEKLVQLYANLISTAG